MDMINALIIWDLSIFNKHLQSLVQATVGNTIRTGLMGTLSKLKLDPSKNRAEQMPHQFHSFNHAYTTSSTQVSDWSIPQCTDIVNMLVCMFKSVLKLLLDRGSCILAATG